MSRAKNSAGEVRGRQSLRHGLQLSDEELVRLLRHGDRAALGELYDRYGAVAYGLALAILKDPPLAEAAVEEAFSEMRRRPCRPPVEGGTVRRRLLVIVHRRSTALVRAESDSRNETRVPVPPRVAALLESLPDAERRTIALSYFGGRTRSELAASARVAPEVIGDRMASGLRRLAPPAPAFIGSNGDGDRAA